MARRAPRAYNTAMDDKNEGKQDWQTPVIEEVTERVMAQPYIRFT